MQESFIESEEEIPLEWFVPETVDGVRLDKVLAELMPAYSRARIQSWISHEKVLVNGKIASVKQRVYAWDKILVTPEPAPEENAFKPDGAVQFTVHWENEDCIVVHKPAGLVVHPGAGNWEGTLLNGLLHHYPALAAVPRAGIVHRLDKDTSGLLVIAKHIHAQMHFVRLLQDRAMGRRYIAFVQGHLKHAETRLRIEQPIGRDKVHPVKMTTVDPIAPKEAITYVQVLNLGVYQGQPVSKVVCQLETGRTHQIRVHLASLGYPLVGDRIYGGTCYEHANRQMLHAFSIEFPLFGNQANAYHTHIPLAQDMISFETHTQWSNT